VALCVSFGYPLGLPQGGSCTVSVAFEPGAAGPLSAALTFTDNALGSPQSVALSGTGTMSFQQVPGSLTQIAVGADGTVWGLNASQQVYRYDPSEPPHVVGRFSASGEPLEV